MPTAMRFFCPLRKESAHPRRAARVTGLFPTQQHNAKFKKRRAAIIFRALRSRTRNPKT